MEKEIKCNVCGYTDTIEHEDLYDCVEKTEVENGIRKGQWMIDWMRRLKEKESKEPYESDFSKWSKSVKKILPILLLLFLGCDEVISSERNVIEDEPVLRITMNLPITSDGFYLFDYPDNRPHTYTSVDYISSPMERVFWYSPDSFSVYHQYHYFSYPIINYSTYTRYDSTVKQMIYIYEPHINDTLSVIGCIQGDYCKEVFFIVTE